MNTPAPAPRIMRIDMPFAIRAYDIDAMGILSNIVYIRWLEDLRTAFLEKYHPLREMLAAGVAPVLAHTDVYYRSPITIQDQPTGSSWVISMGNSKWELGLEIRVGERICCTARQEGIFIDMATRKPTPAPAQLKDAWVREARAPGSPQP